MEAVVRFNKRPMGTKKLVSERLRGEIAKVVAARSIELFDAHMDAAIGDVVIESTDAMGRTTTTTTRPDVASARMLLEYVIGKPAEKKDVRVAVGIINLISSLENGDTDES